MNLVESTIVADRFRLVRKLGQGGMGSVWLAHHTGLDVPCALKFIHPEAAGVADVRARFEHEAKAAAQIRSSHVVQILDHGVWEGMPYIAMEYLEGEDLADRLKRRGKLDPRETLVILSHVARALGKAHGAGLVHRDLKPANIFLVREDDRELAKVLDFGIAKSTLGGLGDGQTKTGALLGTPHYMSPEQAKGLKAVDARSDLWSLAVVAYRCVTGELPFVSDALGGLLMQIIVDPIPVPSEVASVPAGFDAWWARATARDPAHRFQSAREMTDALAVALGISLGDPQDTGERASIESGILAAPVPLAAPPAQSHARMVTLPQITGAGVASITHAPMSAPSSSRRRLAAGAALSALAVAVGMTLFLMHGGGRIRDGAHATAAAVESAAPPAMPAPPAVAPTSSADAAPPEPTATPTASASSLPVTSPPAPAPRRSRAAPAKAAPRKRRHNFGI